MVDLSGKVAIVTGAGSGIGFAIAETLSGAGASVVIDYLEFEEQAQGLAARLPRAIAVHGDVSDRAQVEALVAAARDAFGGVDLLVNNAARSHRSPFLEITDDDWWVQVRTILGGTFLCSQVAGRAMVERGGGAIVNISSIHEDETFPEGAAYCASKGAIRMLMRNLAFELGPLGIRVNNVAPGAIRSRPQSPLVTNPELARRLREVVPLGRMGEVGEVAKLVTFLCSDDASYISGGSYSIDGGMVRFSEPL
ncbi:MAG: SDR family oxidoreductase [Candidatus Dormiibacterota bacterium]